MASRLMELLLRVAAPSDALLLRLRRGDPEAFAQLVRLNQGRLHGFCYRMLGDAEEARDATQDIFLSVHQALPRFREQARLSTWMYRVAMNHCINRQRSRRRRGHGQAMALESAEGTTDGAPTPEEALAVRHEQRRLQRALQVLPEETRALVVLRDVEGLAYDEIVRITGYPEGTVKSRLHRARERLAEVLREEEARACQG